MGRAPAAMKTVTVLAALTVALIAAVTFFAGSYGGLQPNALPRLEDSSASVLLGFILERSLAFFSWLGVQATRVPTLFLGLAALVAFPLLALLGAIFRFFGQDRTPNTSAKTRSKNTTDLHPWPVKAALEVSSQAPGHGLRRYQLDRPVIQIGRADDTDIVLQDPAVHRYHAMIHYSDEAQYVLTDLTAGSGNGVVLNGQPVLQRRIVNGDLIALGRTQIKFIASQL